MFEPDVPTPIAPVCSGGHEEQLAPAAAPSWQAGGSSVVTCQAADALRSSRGFSAGWQCC